MTKISVIVPIYKVETYLVQCVDSILNQTLRDIEVFLIDEGERDGCYMIMQAFATEDSRVKIIHEKCGGYGASCNKGFDAATGEYISIIESDDFIEPEMFEMLYNRAKALEVDVIKGPFFKYYDTHPLGAPFIELCDYAEFVSRSSPPGAFSVLDYPQQMSFHASVWSALYRTDFIKRNKIYFQARGPSSYVDVEFRIRTCVEANKVAWYNKPFYNWRLSNPNSTTNKFNLSAMALRWKEAHDYFDRREEIIYNKVAPYSILDEFWNTVGYFFMPRFQPTEQDFHDVKANMARVPPAIIQASPILNNEQKAMLEYFNCASSLAAFDRFRTA
jgi:glycosyltransferase involved in cell wall biosynthesis